MQAFAPGIYPRSEQLVQATRDLDRGRTSQESVDEQVERDLAELVSDLVVLAEPFFGREETTSPSELEQALGALAGGPRLALQLTFCDAREPLEQGLADLPVDAIGIDFYGTHLSDVPKGFDKLLLAGVVDARSSTLEDPRELALFAERLRSEREGG